VGDQPTSFSLLQHWDRIEFFLHNRKRLIAREKEKNATLKRQLRNSRTKILEKNREILALRDVDTARIMALREVLAEAQEDCDAQAIIEIIRGALDPEPPDHALRLPGQSRAVCIMTACLVA
jgi:hypothetical protein